VRGGAQERASRGRVVVTLHDPSRIYLRFEISKCLSLLLTICNPGENTVMSGDIVEWSLSEFLLTCFASLRLDGMEFVRQKFWSLKNNLVVVRTKSLQCTPSVLKYSALRYLKFVLKYSAFGEQEDNVYLNKNT